MRKYGKSDLFQLFSELWDDPEILRCPYIPVAIVDPRLGHHP
jgi:hypothetical protein